MSVSDSDTSTGGRAAVSNLYLYPIVAFTAVRLAALFLVSETSGESPASAVVGLWFLSLLAVPTVGYLDIRGLRRSGYWPPSASGKRWVGALALPIAGSSVALTYVFRRRDLVEHGGSWSRWVYVSGFGTAVLAASILVASLTGDPSAAGYTVTENAGYTLFVAFMALPGLATYYDLGYLRRTQLRSIARRHWLWVPAVSIWIFQVLSFVGYAVWRRRLVAETADFGAFSTGTKSPIEVATSSLGEARSQCESGLDALAADQYDSALSSFDRAEQSLDEAMSAADELTDGSHDVPPSRVVDVSTAIDDVRTTLEPNHARAEAAVALEDGRDAVDAGDYESAVDSFETAVEQCETALDGLDDEGAADEVRRRLSRAREERDAALDEFVNEELDPLEDRIETAYEDGVSALETGEYDEAADRFADADEYLAEFHSLVESHDPDRDPPVDGDDVDEKLATLERRRVVADELGPLADRIESAYDDGVSALDAGDYRAAIESFETAERTFGPFEAVCEEHDLDADPPVDPDEVADRIAAAERECARTEIETRLDRASDARSEGEAAMDADEHDRAVEAFERAREELDAALDRAEDVGIDEWDLDDRRSTIDGLHGAAVKQRRERRYRDPLERGDERREAAAEAADAGDYGDAVAACGAAREAYEEALRVAEGADVGDAAAVEERLDEVDALHSDYLVRELSGRVREARVPVSEGDRERYLAAADDLAALVADLDEQDVDRERDLAVLREEAERERLKALVLAERERALEAVEAFRDGDYATARDEFEDARAAVAEIRADAEDAGITDYDGVIEQLESTCERNADAARRGALGIADDPAVTPVTVSLGDESTASPAGAAGASATGTAPAANGGTGASAGRAGEVSLNDALRSALPVAEVRGHVGSGGNADVYEVRLESGGRAALKVPRWQGTLSATLIEEFENEAETWSKLADHDGIVSVVDWDDEPLPWLLLEYLPASLADRMDALSVAAGVDVLVDVADALEFAHGRGVVHLDVKPENVLLTADDGPKVGDWGLSQVVLDHTRTGMGLTPPYSAPEQLSDDYGDVDRRTDVYQLSVLAYRVLTGRLPFDADRPVDLQRQILNDDPTPPSTVNPALDPAVDDVLATGLAKDPADRYDAAVLLRNALASLVE